MFNIEQYLKRFSKGIASIELNKTKIIEIINKHTNISVDSSKVEIKDYKVIVDTSAVGKNQIFLNKRKILDDIKVITGINIIDIK